MVRGRGANRQAKPKTWEILTALHLIDCVPSSKQLSQVPIASSGKWVYNNNYLAQRDLKRYKESNIYENIRQ